jgi:hypothetical protein
MTMISSVIKNGRPVTQIEELETQGVAVNIQSLG